MLREIFEECVEGRPRVSLLSQFLLRDAQVIQPSRAGWAAGVFRRQLAPSLERLSLFAEGIQRFAAVEQGFRHLRRLREAVDQLPKSLGRFWMKFSATRLREVVIRQPQIEIRLIELLKLRIFGDDPFKSLAGFVELLVL